MDDRLTSHQAINSMFMVFYAFAMTMVVWCIWCYNEAFGVYMLPFVGRPRPLLTTELLIEQANLPSAGVTPNFPMCS